VDLERLLEPGRLFQGALMHTLLRDGGDVRELQSGQLLGAFRIVRELGRGGMGIVYAAERADGEYQQEVAIKWLPGGALDPTHLEQFRHERQILAQLRHPHIARLLDGGHDADGHLWFAMERVEGLPIDHHAAAESLSWRERVTLLLPVVDAVLFAHGRLLVHRDIKPNNVLVDNDGRAKLLDFGVAALLSETDANTAFTPGYASPEQRDGARPDVASDIWQLGRLLQVVMEASPAPKMPGDLAAVIAKAMEPMPMRRYVTASALQADLRRVLDYRPIAARVPSFPHRLRLLLQAHPWVVLGSALAFTGFCAVVMGFTWSLAQQRDEAERARGLAVAVNSFLNDGLLPGVDPLQGGSNDITATQLIIHALDSAEHRLQGSPEVAGEVEASLGRSLANLGQQEQALRALDRAVAHLTQARGPQHASVLEARLAREQFDLDMSHIRSADTRLAALREDIVRYLGPHAPLVHDIDNQFARAAYLREDFARCETLYAAIIKSAAGAKPGPLADTYDGLSQCEARRGHFSAALEHALEAQSLRERVYGRDHPGTLETGLAVETALIGLGRYDEAIVVLHDLQSALGHRYGEIHPTTLTVTHDLGFAMTCAGRADDGATWLRRAAEGRAKLLGRTHAWVGMSEAVLAMALTRGGHFAQAQAALDSAESILQTHPADNPYAQAILRENQADLALANAHYSLAIERYDAAITAAVPLYAADHPRRAVLELGHGLALWHDGQIDAGRAAIEGALAILGDKADCRADQIAQARKVLAKTR
jgi:tetratricopeptide (TPR) repeat protein